MQQRSRRLRPRRCLTCEIPLLTPCAGRRQSGMFAFKPSSMRELIESNSRYNMFELAHTVYHCFHIGWCCWACAHIWAACRSTAPATTRAGSARATALTTTPRAARARDPRRAISRFRRTNSSMTRTSWWAWRDNSPYASCTHHPLLHKSVFLSIVCVCALLCAVA